MKEFPNLLGEGPQIQERLEAWKGQDNYKCGCTIKYYVNQDGTLVRERDWCQKHVHDDGEQLLDENGKELNIFAP